jgi:hypothetical protein
MMIPDLFVRTLGAPTSFKDLAVETVQSFALREDVLYGNSIQ